MLAFSRPCLGFDAAALSKKIFDEKTKDSCVVLSRGLDTDISTYDKGLADFINKVIDGLKNRDAKALTPLFHKNLKITQDWIRVSIFNEISASYANSKDIGIYRIWATNSKGENETSPVVCAQDALALQPHYGYDIQFAVWLQVRSAKELGRAFFTVVPARDNKWQIAFFTLQRWTHMGIDAEAWIDDALTDIEKKQKITGYLKLDIAEKLLSLGGNVLLALRNDVLATKQSLYKTQDLWTADLKKTLEKWDIAYAGSLFADDGAGLLVRYVVDDSKPNSFLADDCNALGKAFYAATSSSSKIGGIRCAFMKKEEDPNRDGVKGGRFFSRASIEKN
jgi:hypothetical protein